MPRISTAQRKARQAAVTEGIAAGKSLRAIADELGCHPNTITSDLRAITDNFSAWADGEIAAARQTAIANLQAVINAAWAGYDESWRMQRTWLAGGYDQDDVRPDPDRGMVHTVRKAPALRLEMATYLDRVTKATEALCKLTGAAAPARMDVIVTHEVAGDELDDAYSRIADPAERAAFLGRVRAADAAALLAEQAFGDLALPGPE